MFALLACGQRVVQRVRKAFRACFACLWAKVVQRVRKEIMCNWPQANMDDGSTRLQHSKDWVAVKELKLF